MTISKGVVVLASVIALLIAFSQDSSYGKGHSGGKSREGRSCTYDKCVDKCVARTGAGYFANARCSQKCAKRGCT
jgi:hypothetical protein